MGFAGLRNKVKMNAIKINDTHYLKSISITRDKINYNRDGSRRSVDETITIQTIESAIPLPIEEVNAIKSFLETIGLECNWKAIKE